jgi:hypothetical protein
MTYDARISEEPATITAKHTPGPWHTGAGNGEGSIFCKEGRLRLNDRGTALYSICQVTHGYDQAEDDANASLIAAAPELLEALRRLLDSPCCNEDDQEDETAEAIQQAIDAVGKAEGR